MDYYDNEDGYWDKFIEKKESGWAAWADDGMVIGRPFFKH
jgi:hypothetical protein